MAERAGREEDWVPVYELVNPADLKRLQALWAIPYVGDLPFEFREESDAPS